MYSSNEIRFDGRCLISGYLIKACVMLLSSMAVLFLIVNLPRFSSLAGLGVMLEGLISGERARLISKGIVVFIAALSFIAGLFAVASLKAGREAWFWRRAKDQKVRALSVFAWFAPGKTLRALSMYLRIFIRRLLWFMLFFSPCALLITGTVIWAKTKAQGVPLLTFLIIMLTAAAIFVAGAAAYFVVTKRYFMAYYLLCENDNIKPLAAIKRSVELMEGRCGRAAKFKLSFILWFILCVFIIPIFYVYPYYKQSCAALGRSFITEKSSVKLKPIVFKL